MNIYPSNQCTAWLVNPSTREFRPCPTVFVQNQFRSNLSLTMVGSRTASLALRVLLVVQLVLGFYTAKDEVRSCRADYRPPWKVYLDYSLVCWMEGKVLWPIDYKCYTLNGRGEPCRRDQRLVFSKR